MWNDANLGIVVALLVAQMPGSSGDDETGLYDWRGRGKSNQNLLYLVVNGTVTNLNRRWYKGAGPSSGRPERSHPAIKWMAATLDGRVDPGGAVFEAKFMLPWAFSEEAAAEKHMAQLQHICG
jgi:hypothetical protein